MAQLPSQSQFGDYGEWPGRDVLDSGGERLGGVREIYLDRETGRPEWVLVDVDGDEARFVPLADAAVESSTIRVAHSAAAIRNAPGIGVEARIDQTEERRLYEHYGIGYAEAGSGLPADEPEVVPPWRRDTTDEPEEATSSWSAAAGEEEPSNLAPPPAEPPSPDELEAADIAEPPAVTEPEPFSAEPDALPPAALGPESPTGLTTPSGAGEILATGAGAPEALVREPEPDSADLVESDLTAQHGPDAVGVFSTPAPTPVPPVAAVPDPVVSPPPAPEPPRPRPFAVPPAAEESAGTLEALKSPRGGILAGVTIAALLFFIIRRLR